MLTLLLPLLPLIRAASQGSVSLWSDSSCRPGASSNFGERDPVALNYTLNIDTCGNPGATVHSYTINQRPTCPNGTVAAFAFYSTPNCVLPPQGFSATDQFNPSNLLDGACLALVAFDSMAFICDGLGNNGNVSTSAPASDMPAMSSMDSAYATPISPNARITAPPYAITPVADSISPSGVMPSGMMPSGTGAPYPSPGEEFMGAGAKLGAPIVAIFALFGAILVL